MTIMTMGYDGDDDDNCDDDGVHGLNDYHNN